MIIGAQARLAWLKFNRIGVDGKYVNAFTNRHDWAPTLATSSGSPYPPQVSLVATFETGAARGLAHRGRMFLPTPLAAIDADGRITGGAAASAATKVAALLSALNALPGYGESRVYSNVRAGASRPITGVTVGRVLDTMRSRRSQLAEERSPVMPVGGS